MTPRDKADRSKSLENRRRRRSNPCRCTDRWIDPNCYPTLIGGQVKCQNFGRPERRVGTKRQ